VTCAVCDKLNSPLILGSDVVDRLYTLMLKEHYPLTEAVSHKPCVDCHAADADVCLISDDDVVDEESVDDIKALSDADDDIINDNVDSNDQRTSTVETLIAEQKSDSIDR